MVSFELEVIGKGKITDEGIETKVRVSKKGIFIEMEKMLYHEEIELINETVAKYKELLNYT